MADYNSKYTGEQVEEMLDQIANGEIGGGGGIAIETDPIFSASPAASITEEKKAEWDNKVDNVSGKGLSTEDFTSALKTKLEGLNNYDDTELSNALSTLRGDFDTLVSGDTTTAIKTFNEVIAFLDSISDTEDLAGIIASIEQQLMWTKVEGEAGVRLKGTNGTATGNMAISAGDDKTASDGTPFTSAASGDHAVAFGYGNTCAGRTTLAQGLYNIVNGKDSVAFGQRNLVDGDQAFASGQQNEVSARIGVAIGYKNKATNTDSIAIGYQNTSSGSASVAMGDTCEASGTSSTAMGYKTKATGASSSTFGQNTQATNAGEVAMGLYNKSTTSTEASEQTLFSFGIGTSDTDRTNAFEIKKNGDVYVGDKILSDFATTTDLDGKVDKISGKQLTTEDFTSALKTKLEGLSNYDDTELSDALSTLRGDFDKLVSGDTTTAIKSFNEVIAFLDGIQDTEDLSGIIASIEQQIAGKQDVIEGLDDINEKLEVINNIVDTDGYLYSNGEKVDMRFTRSLLPVGTSIPASANLNTIDYLKVGKYYCSLNVDAATVKNCPVNVAFSMEVFNPLGTNVDDETTSDYTYRLRVLTQYDTGQQYIQFCKTSGTAGSWTYNAWYVTPRVKFTLNSSKNDGSAAIGATNKGVYVDSTGEIKAMSYTVAKSVPSNAVFTDTNTKVTAVGNHYTPAEDTTQQIDAPSGEVVTGIKRDAAGHVVGVVTTPQSGGSGGGIAVETDPVFSASPAASITEDKKAEWDNKMDKVTLATVATTGSYNDLSNKPTIPSAVTESTVSGWGFTKNTGTVTKVKINGSEKTPDTNGLVDLGTISGGSSSSGGSGAYAEVNHGTSDTTSTLTPNTFHIWDEVSALALTLGSETTGVANEFLFQFTSGAIATSLSLPDDLKWANDTAPTISENMIYQVSILKGLASVLEFSNEVNIFPMYFTTPDSGYMEANEQSITLADYVLNNAVFDGARTWECVIPEKSVYIDGHEVGSFLVISEDKDSYPYEWRFSDGYDYDYMMFVSNFYVTGEQKGQMERYDDD